MFIVLTRKNEHKRKIRVRVDEIQTYCLVDTWSDRNGRNLPESTYPTELYLIGRDKTLYVEETPEQVDELIMKCQGWEPAERVEYAPNLPPPRGVA